MGDTSHGFTLDEALSTVGFGRFQTFAAVYTGFGWFIDAMEISLLSFIGTAVKSEWALSPTEESLLSTAVFAGMFLGASFWGFVADNWGRRIGARGVTMSMFVAGLLSAFSPDYRSLVILRFFLGFGAGGTHVFSSWFLEFMPSSNRGAWLLGLNIFWILGEVMEASLAWIILPRFGWRCLLALSSLPSLTVLLFSSITPESPRYLFTKGRTNEAIAVLEKVASMNRKQLPSGNLVAENQGNIRLDEEKVPSEETPLLSSNEHKTTSLQTSLKPLVYLFSSDVLRTTTLLLWFVSFVNPFSYYGLQLMISMLSSGQTDCGTAYNSILSENVGNDSLYVSSFVTYLAELPGLLIALVIVDRIGRKLSMEALIIAGVVFMLPVLFHLNATEATALLVISRTLISASFSIFSVYGKEVYPTSVRASGFGLANAVGRLGGVVSPLVAVGLVGGCHQTLAVILFGIVILTAGICVVFLPFETKGRELADDVS